MEFSEEHLPPYSDGLLDDIGVPSAGFNRKQIISPVKTRSIFLVIFIITVAVFTQWKNSPAITAGITGMTPHGLSIQRLERDLATCSTFRHGHTNPIGSGREKSDRFVGGKPTLIKNATVWVGEPTSGGAYSWITADVFLENGLIKQVGMDLNPQRASLNNNLIVHHAEGRPLTSGLIDLHSHAGVHSLPTLHTNDDTSELSSNIAPYIRSIDGIQPTDWQLQVTKSGGVTTSLILPGSGNNIGGEAFVVKHAIGPGDGRNETSLTDILADRTLRHMKMACGENPKRVHGKSGEYGPTSRLGQSWEFRHAFEQAAEMLLIQDDWCNNAARPQGLERSPTYLPRDLRWEPLVAVLRGQVHVHVHCYTIPDLEAFVHHTNQFNFSVRAFHHAHQAFLVPEILKRAWGSSPPAAALFADNMWYKAEAYIGSEHASKRLYDNGLVPIFVSDNPIINAQNLVFEAAKAYRHGLPYHAAIAAVTTAPAERLGLGRRLGKVKPGFDADVVIWDSDPLSIGATPVQVWIDGATQYENPVELAKLSQGTLTPNPDLSNVSESVSTVDGSVVFTGIVEDFLSAQEGTIRTQNKPFNVAVTRGRITCIGQCRNELRTATDVIRLTNGYLTSAATALGSTLGMSEIDSEPSTDNGADRDAAFSRAADSVAFDTTKLHAAYRSGVTRAISAPKFVHEATHHGTSAGFLVGASAVIANISDAIFASDTALHYTLGPSVKQIGTTSSISGAVGQLRQKLLRAVADRFGSDRTASSSFKATKLALDLVSEGAYLRRVVEGSLPLVISAHNADVIAALLRVKSDVEKVIHSPKCNVRLVIVGGAEAHLVASELADAAVGVVLAPIKSFGVSWDQRRALTGAPLTNGTAIDALTAAGVLVAIGLEEDWVVRDLWQFAGTAYRNGGGRITTRQALDLVGHNVYRLLGLEEDNWRAREHFVLHNGNPLNIDSHIKAVSGGTGKVSIYNV